jgi:hypothetical protein
MTPQVPADLSQLSLAQKDALIVALLARIAEMAAQAARRRCRLRMRRCWRG